MAVLPGVDPQPKWCVYWWGAGAWSHLCAPSPQIFQCPHSQLAEAVQPCESTTGVLDCARNLIVVQIPGEERQKAQHPVCCGKRDHAQPATLKLRTSQSIPDAWTACLPKITGVRKQTYACLYTWLDLKWITNKDLLNSTGSSAQCHVAAWEGRGLGENGHMRVYG